MEVNHVHYDDPARRIPVVIGSVVLAIFIFAASAALFGAFGALAGIVAGIVAAGQLGKRFATKTAGRSDIEIADGRLTIPSINLSLPLSDITGGLDSIADRSVVLDTKMGASLYLGIDEGEALLEKLGVKQRTTRVPLRRTLGRFVMGLVTFFASLFVAGFIAPFLRALFGHVSVDTLIWTMFLMASLATAFVVLRFGAPHVVVGTDGIRIKGMMRQGFIPYSSIKGVQYKSPSLILFFNNAPPRVLPMIAVAHERRRGLIAKIERAIGQQSAGRSRLSDALVRAGKPVDTWREDLTKLASRQHGFRDAAFEREDVESVLQDPKASAEQRVGAAYVLYRIDPEAGETQVRIAAEQTAEEDLREALFEAAKGRLRA